MFRLMARRFMKKFVFLLVFVMIINVIFQYGKIDSISLETSGKSSYEIMSEVGVLRGTLDGLELDRQITRSECVALIIRAIGEEEKALTYSSFMESHHNVKEWAVPYMNYALEHQLIRGMREDYIGGSEPINLYSFLTMLIRLLDYSDLQGDFSWEKVVEKAYEIGLVDYEESDNYLISRGESVDLLYRAYGIPMKESEETLLMTLVNEEKISVDTALKLEIVPEELLMVVNDALSDELIPSSGSPAEADAAEDDSSPTDAAGGEDSQIDEVVDESDDTSGNLTPGSGETTVTESPVVVPKELLVENSVNQASKIRSFIEEHNGESIVFPDSGTYFFDRPIVIANMNNTVIDFNHTVIKIKDGFTGWSDALRFGNSVYIGDAAVGVVDSKDTMIKGLVVDGNKSRVSSQVQTIGIWVGQCDNVTFYDNEVKNVSYHGIVLGDGTKNVRFEQLKLRNNFGSDNCSDVYINNKETDSSYFEGVDARRDTLSGDKVFYIDGYNSNIKDLYTYNCSVGIGYRKGTHYAEDLYMERCNSTIYIISTTNTNFADVTVKNLKGINIRAEANTRTGLGIWAVKKARFENVYLEFGDDVTTGNWGVVIRRINPQHSISDVRLKNVTVVNSVNAAVYYEDLVETTIVDGLTAYTKDGYVLRTYNVSSNQYIDYIVSENTSIDDPNDKLRYFYK